MLIPSIDLQGGRIVQLVQGERLAVESHDVGAWIERFEKYPAVQLIDLDAAKGQGRNTALVEQICAARPCRLGGGIRTPDDAERAIAAGATHVIVGSALFTSDGVDTDAAATFADRLGASRVIAAVDSKGGRVVIHGWRTRLSVAPADAIRALEPYVEEFLYTHVDREGLMMGTDFGAVEALRKVTNRRLTVAGGITSWDEIARLEAMRVDAVVGMAIYTGRMNP